MIQDDDFEARIEAELLRTSEPRAVASAPTPVSKVVGQLPDEKPDAKVENWPEWLWYCESTSGVPVVTFGRWPKHPEQARYKLAAIQPTEHDHPEQTDEEVARCVVCDEGIEDGDLAYWSTNDDGHMHAECATSYVGDDGKETDAPPKPMTFRADASPVSNVGIEISEAEVKALLYGVPRHEFSVALTRLAAWLAERDDTTPESRRAKRRRKHTERRLNPSPAPRADP